MVYKGHATQMPLLHKGTLTQSPTTKGGDLTMEKGKGKQTLAQDTLSTKTSPPPQPPHIQPCQRTMPCSHNLPISSVTRWIPKKLLQAQGYFKGERDVWLPRQPQHQKPTFPSRSKPCQPRANKVQHRVKTHRQWVPV